MDNNPFVINEEVYLKRNFLELQSYNIDVMGLDQKAEIEFIKRIDDKESTVEDFKLYNFAKMKKTYEKL
jgi:hypothetical protein